MKCGSRAFVHMFVRQHMSVWVTLPPWSSERQTGEEKLQLHPNENFNYMSIIIIYFLQTFTCHVAASPLGFIRQMENPPAFRECIVLIFDLGSLTEVY